MPRNPDAKQTPTPSPELPDAKQTPAPARNPFFREPKPRLDPLSPDNLSPERADRIMEGVMEQGPLSSSNPGPASDGPGSESPSGTRSIGEAKAARPAFGKAQLRKLTTAAVAALGNIAHQALTRPETPERDSGLWLPDEQDVEALADPLAGIAARRTPAGVAGPDTGDIVALVVGLVGYVGKQLATRAELRAKRAEQALADLTDPAAEVPA